MLALCLLWDNDYLISSVIGSVCKTYFDELWKHDSRRWEVIPFLIGDPHNETAWCIFNIFQCFLFSTIRGVVTRLLLFHFSKWFFVLFEFYMYRAIIFPRIVSLFSTVIAGDMVKLSLGFLVLVFCFTYIIPSFPILREHKFIYYTVGLVFTIIIKVRLVI